MYECTLSFVKCVVEYTESGTRFSLLSLPLDHVRQECQTLYVSSMMNWYWMPSALMNSNRRSLILQQPWTRKPPTILLIFAVGKSLATDDCLCCFSTVGVWRGFEDSCIHIKNDIGDYLLMQPFQCRKVAEPCESTESIFGYKKTICRLPQFYCLCRKLNAFRITVEVARRTTSLKKECGP